MTSDQIDQLKAWIKKKKSEGDPTSISDESLLALHFDGIADSARDISALLKKALESNEPEAIDDLIVDLEIEVEHLNNHWSELKQVTRDEDDSA